MKLIKTSWEKEAKKEIPLEVMENIAARGSFVVVKSKYLFRELNEENNKKNPKKHSINHLSIEEQINYKIKEVNFKMWMENLGANISIINKSEDISKIPSKKGKRAIIVGAGPSFSEKKHIEILKLTDRNLYEIISTDRMLIPLLEAGIEPDYVVSADGHREKILPFYQSSLINNNIKTQAVMMNTVAPNVTNIFPNKLFFFTPMIDDIEIPFSLSAAMSAITRTSVLATGGNVGITSIFLAYFLKYDEIILTGMNLGYTIDTPIEKSQYYPIIKEADPSMTPEKYKEIYIIEGHNPDFNLDYYTDITWKSHIDHIIESSEEMAKSGVKIINATEGGAIHGGSIICMTLKEALKKDA